MAKITCARCGRRLKDGRWIYSRFTKRHYCWPTECRARRRKAVAR